MRSRWPRLLLLMLGWLVPNAVHAITVTVAWDYTTSSQTGFQLKRCTGASCTPSTNIGSVLGPSLRQTTDTTVTGGTTYGYAVVATDTPDSGISNILYVTVPTPGVATHLVYTTPPQVSTLTNQALNTIVVAVRDAFETTVSGSTASITVALLPPTESPIPQNQLTLPVPVDSQETISEPGQGTRAIDGQNATFWHTAYTPTVVPLPHTLIVDLGMPYPLTSFKYLPRQDGGFNGIIAGYQFSVSLDGSTWGAAAASGTFAANATEKTVTFAGRSGRYVRLVATSEINGNQFTSVAELTVLQTPTGGGQLNGVTTGNVTAGVRQFPGLSVTQAGTYTMQATSSGLTLAQSAFVIVDPTVPTIMPYVLRLR